MPYLGQRVKLVLRHNLEGYDWKNVPTYGTVTAVLDDEICEQSICITQDVGGWQGWFTNDFRTSIFGSVVWEPVEVVGKNFLE